MSEAAEKLKPALLALTVAERAEVAEYLATLTTSEGDEEELSEEEWEDQWAEEINRRVADFEAGKTELIPYEEVKKKMKEKYG